MSGSLPPLPTEREGSWSGAAVKQIPVLQFQ